MDLAIVLFVMLSYISGSKAILNNKYRPSVYSRVIWLLLVTNGFISVLALRNSFAVILLAGLGVLGNLVILFLSLKKSSRIFGKTELVASIFLIFSLFVWLFAKLPFLNLSIGLIAHFIGGIPTYKRVINDPRDENIWFWFFFFIATMLTIISTDKTHISNYLYPLYYALFNGSMFLFCLRKYIR